MAEVRTYYHVTDTKPDTQEDATDRAYKLYIEAMEQSPQRTGRLPGIETEFLQPDLRIPGLIGAVFSKENPNQIIAVIIQTKIKDLAEELGL